MAIGKIHRPLNRCCREPLGPCRFTYHHPRQAGAKAENCAQRFLFRELHTYLFIPLGLVSDVFRPLNALLDSGRRRLANKAHLCAKRATRCLPPRGSLALATSSAVLPGFTLLALSLGTHCSGSRLPAPISASASLDSPRHSGSAIHASARLMPGISFSLPRTCRAFSEKPIHSREKFKLPRSAISSIVDTTSWSSRSAFVSIRDIPSPAVPCVAFCSSGSAAFVSFVRTIFPPIPDFCSAALRRSIVADFVGSPAHFVPLCSTRRHIRQDPFQDSSFHARFRGK